MAQIKYFAALAILICIGCFAAIIVKVSSPEPETQIVTEYIDRIVEVPAEPEKVIEYVPTVQYIEVPCREENRFSSIELSQDDIELLAALTYHEARGECSAGQRMVIEVVLNRVLDERFPCTVREVIYQRNQFSPAPLLASTEPTAAQYDAVMAVLTDSPITDENVIYFSQAAYNINVFATVGGHTFCGG